ncbi:L,D-transpeptidase family protein [Salipaludibacillus daqingensis]|uniref:L,D-transpeptidase family protein n=1 Tax=Salipaludibacillus daqingensis TaxID=3041001 RepID=UPI002473B646|nr:peptidoglycan-binding protein [Salipaludibacillus daqingensis]
MKKFLAPIIILLLLFTLQIPTASAASEQLIIINKSNNELAFYDNSKLIKKFDVATGKSSTLTPEGKFKIVNKIVNRPYYKENIPGGDPRNPLGNRWLGLNAKGTNGNTYAIHGNNNPSSIGQYVSAGCIRMHNNQILWLFNRVKVNTTVIITSSNQSFNQIAKANGYKLSGENVSTAPKFTSIYRLGSKGDGVKSMQKELTSLGYNPKGVDGIFGPATRSAVMTFQRDHKLKVDGIAGPQTLKSISNKQNNIKQNSSKTSTSPKVTTLKIGSRGSAVTTLQQKLNKAGYNTKGVDGIFGPATRSAVIKFQRHHKLQTDGIAGPKTHQALNKK